MWHQRGVFFNNKTFLLDVILYHQHTSFCRMALLHIWFHHENVFCCVSCDKVTYFPFSSFLNSKDFKWSWWWNSSPWREKNWSKKPDFASQNDRRRWTLFQVRKKNEDQLVQKFLCNWMVGREVPDLILSFSKPSSARLAILNSLSLNISIDIL